MFPKITKDKEIFDKLFIVSSVFCFVLLFFLMRNSNLNPFYHNFNDNVSENNVSEKSDYVLAGSKDIQDPFITKNLNLEGDFLKRPILDGSYPSLGSNDAKVNIVEFSDFTCEFCKEQELIIKKVVEKYKDNVRLIWKYYPNFSGFSLESAVAANCAFEQNKFWEFQEKFFEKNDDVASRELFLSIADELNINKEEFIDCLNNERSLDIIKKNIKEANSLKIPGVPFFFVGNQEILGEINEKELEMMIITEMER